MASIDLSSFRFARVPTFLLCTAALSAGCASEQDTPGEEEEDLGSGASAIVYHAPLNVGVRGQQDYQNNWCEDVGNSDAWWRCGNFINQIQSTDYVRYYYNLHGAEPMFEGSSGAGWDAGGLDSVDFFFMQTHGGFNTAEAAFAMWDQYQMARTSSMRLGEKSIGLSVLATYSCDTLYTADGLALNRWYGTFAGGLRMVVGAHNHLYAGGTASSTDFATRMQNGEPIGQAWLESTYYNNTWNHPAIMNTGANSTDCWNRMGATLGNVRSIPRLRDGQIGYVCWGQWN